MSTKQLYDSIRDATGTQLADMEQIVSDLSGASPDASAYDTGFLRLEAVAATFRMDATHYLNTVASGAFDDEMLHEAKRHVHTDVGRVLTALRAHIREMEEAEGRPGATTPYHAPLLAAWREVLESLRTGEWPEETVDAHGQIARAAAAAGVKPVFTTEAPTEETALRAYIKEASAKIIAAVRAGEDTVTL